MTGCENRKNTALPAVRPAAGPVREEVLPIPAGVDLVIREKMFIAQVNDVYINRNDYLGKTIMLEGLFKYGEYGGREYCYVIRNGPGCCGDDGQVGFEVAWNQPDQPPADASEKKTYPRIDDWVEARGVLKRYEEQGQSFIYLALSNLEVMNNRRGAVFVVQ
jgi:uncharacterized membrane protein YcgQ (UPF0703/DUF1980 family)